MKVSTLLFLTCILFAACKASKFDLYKVTNLSKNEHSHQFELDSVNLFLYVRSKKRAYNSFWEVKSINSDKNAKMRVSYLEVNDSTVKFSCFTAYEEVGALEYHFGNTRTADFIFDLLSADVSRKSTDDGMYHCKAKVNSEDSSSIRYSFDLVKIKN